MTPPSPQCFPGSGVTLTLCTSVGSFVCLGQRLCKGGHVAPKKKTKSLQFITVNGDHDSPRHSPQDCLGAQWVSIPGRTPLLLVEPSLCYHSCYTHGETEAWREELLPAQGHIEGVAPGLRQVCLNQAARPCSWDCREDPNSLTSLLPQANTQ